MHAIAKIIQSYILIEGGAGMATHSTQQTDITDIENDINRVFVCDSTGVYKLNSIEVPKDNKFKCSDKTILVEFELKKPEVFAKSTGNLLTGGGCISNKPLYYPEKHCQNIKRYLYISSLFKIFFFSIMLFFV